MMSDCAYSPQHANLNLTNLQLIMHDPISNDDQEKKAELKKIE